ncbi:MAG: DUF1801 domain-containing protein [Alphaproteobacteria bacterium]
MGSETARPMAPEVAAVFAGCPAAARARMMALRRQIFDTAAATPGVGPLTETLKWGEPAYLTAATGSGSTVRIGWKPTAPDRVGVYFNCRTRLVDRFRTMFAGELTFEGNRAILLDISQPLPDQPLAACLALALTYHRNKGRP